MGCGCRSDDTGSEAWVGSGLKFAVTMNCEGFDMDTDDWVITVTCGKKSVTFTSKNSVKDGGQWYICLDSSELGPGEAYITFEARVPDKDFKDGIRTEIRRYKLVNLRSPKIIANYL